MVCNAYDVKIFIIPEHIQCKAGVAFQLPQTDNLPASYSFAKKGAVSVAAWLLCLGIQEGHSNTVVDWNI